MLIFNGTNDTDYANCLLPPSLELKAAPTATDLSNNLITAAAALNIPIVQNLIPASTFQLNGDAVSIRNGTYSALESTFANQIFTIGPVPIPKRISFAAWYKREMKCCLFKVFGWNLNKTTMYPILGYVDRNCILQTDSTSGFFSNGLIFRSPLIADTNVHSLSGDYDISTFNNCFTQGETSCYLSFDCQLIVRSADHTINYSSYPFWLRSLKFSW